MWCQYYYVPILTSLLISLPEPSLARTVPVKPGTVPVKPGTIGGPPLRLTCSSNPLSSHMSAQPLEASVGLKVVLGEGDGEGQASSQGSVCQGLKSCRKSWDQMGWEVVSTSDAQPT